MRVVITKGGRDMTLQDIEAVFTPSDIDIVIGAYNDGHKFKLYGESEVLWKGKLENADQSDYYKCDIADVEIVNNGETFIVALNDEEEGKIINKTILNHYIPKVKKMLIDGYTTKQTIGCIYGLYTNYLINEATENALYEMVDPDDEIDESPGELWNKIGFDNPLEK